MYSLPGELYKRGVKIAFASYDAHAVRNLPYAAGFAAALGIAAWAAANLKAITLLNKAEIWGVADQLGSLDVGKTANVVVADGDPLDVGVKSDVKRIKKKKKKKKTRRRSGGAGAGIADGSVVWSGRPRRPWLT